MPSTSSTFSAASRCRPPAVVLPSFFFLSPFLSLSPCLAHLPPLFFQLIRPPFSFSLSLYLHPPPRAPLFLFYEARERVAAVFWSTEGRDNGVCVRRDAEGWWLKRGGVQSDYAKLCPYVLAWKFHPSPGLPPRLGKCIYCCLSSVLYMATASE